MKIFKTVMYLLVISLNSCGNEERKPQTVFCEKYKLKLPVTEWNNTRLELYKVAIENDVVWFEDRSAFKEGTQANTLSVKIKTGRSTISLASSGHWLYSPDEVILFLYQSKSRTVIGCGSEKAKSIFQAAKDLVLPGTAKFNSKL